LLNAAPRFFRGAFYLTTIARPIALCGSRQISAATVLSEGAVNLPLPSYSDQQAECLFHRLFIGCASGNF